MEEPSKMAEWPTERLLWETDLALRHNDIRKMALIAFELSWRENNKNESANVVVE